MTACVNNALNLVPPFVIFVSSSVFSLQLSSPLIIFRLFLTEKGKRLYSIIVECIHLDRMVQPMNAAVFLKFLFCSLFLVDQIT